MPSLTQLSEAVMAFIGEFPDDKITVVVDATFGHRIDPSEVAEFNAAIENNELVCPPAGAVGRGDAFVLAIAHKVGAAILSNDSYQEFHGDHDWLFDEGRLIGGKPVPHVGWVFVLRTPVRGPISRRAVKGKSAPGRERGGPRPTSAASLPMPVPKSPPPRGRVAKEVAMPVDDAIAAAVTEVASAASDSGRAERGGRNRRGGRDREKVSANGVEAASGTPRPVRSAQAPAQARTAFVNEPLPFLAFVDAHPAGTQVEATVESYSSHGAYVLADGARCYIPLRFMDDPAPRAARDVLKLGQSYSFVVVSFNAGRRSVDIALPGFVPAGVPEAPAVAEPVKGRRTKKAAAATPPTPVVESVVAEPAKGRRTKKAAAPVVAVEATPVAERVMSAPAQGRRGKKAAPALEPVPPASDRARARRSGRRGAAVDPPTPRREPVPAAAAPSVDPAKGRGARKAATPAKAPARAAQPPTRKASAQVVPTPVAAPAKAVKAPAKAAKAAKVPAKAIKAAKVPAKAAKAPAKKAPAKVVPAPVRAASANAPVKAAPAKKVAKAAPVKAAPAKKVAKAAPAKVAPARVAPARVAPARVAPARVVTAKAAPAKAPGRTGRRR